MFYDKNGKEISQKEWRKLFTKKYKRVASTQIKDFDVSTVWLGIDYSFKNEGPPIIFETMVFKKGFGSCYLERYSTKDEALLGHDIICDKLKEENFVDLTLEEENFLDLASNELKGDL